MKKVLEHILAELSGYINSVDDAGATTELELLREYIEGVLDSLEETTK